MNKPMFEIKTAKQKIVFMLVFGAFGCCVLLLISAVAGRARAPEQVLRYNQSYSAEYYYYIEQR